ncbi:MULTISPECIES: GNAT family N-acetyltransferase [unclassified Nocardioides]|uniref:GNAT family N-acetyltransferase n=1 Tax=unclassified Nocardioides TaxID=2615069 RepID=UPI0006FDE81B|nr:MULTISPECIES: GNAT family N-acetyltransferase [unclassified Nocardioides]KRA38038.1 GCN5 family acetyltransferase [Nocardioides sp. Root614]KRA91998.1 GCN5 family acetyltransferase [Nocardioides sp. Root682]
MRLPDGVREATPTDVPDILRLVRELAAYEREPDAVATTEGHLHTWLFGPDPVASVLVAEADDRVVGIALWFRTYSTWTGVPGIYLEDLYVEPGQRGSGLGKALLTSLATIAVERGYQRVEWAVLDWNTPAIEFYEALGARPMQEWTTYRLTGAALAELSALGGA